LIPVISDDCNQYRTRTSSDELPVRNACIFLSDSEGGLKPTLPGRSLQSPA
jgi:hypothetical protein